MCKCHAHGSCHGCSVALDRRRFLNRLGAATTATAGGLASLQHATAEPAERKAPAVSGEKVRVAAVFLANINIREIWPYPGFDTKSRQQEVLGLLEEGCPEVEFIPVTVEAPADVQKAIALKDDVDGYLVYTMTLDWRQSAAVAAIADQKKPMLVADEFLGGSGVFLTAYSRLRTRKIPAAAVSSRRLDDLVAVARQFATLHEPGTTPASFAQRCEKVYRELFSGHGDMACADDPLALTEIGECVRRFRESRFLIVGRGTPGQQRDFLGVKARYVDFAELLALYEKVDPDQAAEWADRWRKTAKQVMESDPEAIRKAARVYLATLELLKKYETDNVTMNCLGGFAAGKLPAYPCLGFMQILNDGGQGVCEAMPDDTLSMIMARILTGRPGFVSDPALDTSKNQIVYAHCVATTKVLGTKGTSNSFRIRTLHNRDPRGACAESFLPPGYMTTTFRTNLARKQMILHQAKAVGTLDSEHGCRTKLIGEVCGDIGKLFDQWDQFGWHRVTLYGDVAAPLAEFAQALDLEVIHEA